MRETRKAVVGLQGRSDRVQATIERHGLDGVYCRSVRVGPEERYIMRLNGIGSRSMRAGSRKGYPRRLGMVGDANIFVL